MEVCTACRLVILAHAVEWRTVQTAKQTHSSPSEHELMPFHRACVDGEWDAYADERRRLKGATDAQMERF